MCIKYAHNLFILSLQTLLELFPNKVANVLVYFPINLSPAGTKIYTCTNTTLYEIHTYTQTRDDLAFEKKGL